jgi:2,3-bisphosphoglycerate-independent phosphoglycerate mutase
VSRPVALIILDGFGLAPDGPSNAVARAVTPNFDRYRQIHPFTELKASGTAVGLPPGQIGNSEVGHLNIGAGRVVQQSLSFIKRQIDNGQFFDNPVLNESFCVGANSVHLLGLLSRGGVHSHLNHLFALLELAKRNGAGPVYVHAFTDGRDTSPTSGLEYVRELEGFIESLKHDIQIATVTGRYFAMDRDNRWTRTARAFDAVVAGKADKHAASGIEAIEAAYTRGETDEFLSPTVIMKNGRPIGPIEHGDSLVFFNFRSDRARQFSRALVSDAEWAEFPRSKTPILHFASLMQIDSALARPFAFEMPPIANGLGEVLSHSGLIQYHAAESEKYAHVTYFFNARQEKPFPGEERLLVPSPQVATYDLKPEMSAIDLANELVKRLRTVRDDFILINFANPDMVGHTGVLEATIKACEATDKSMGMIVETMQERGGTAVIVADHGNAEMMIAEDGGPHTAHTTNPVPCILVGGDRQLQLRHGGILGDVAPTILQLLGLTQPEEMTGRSLLKN